eukprot:269847-Rhodomonas_salina.1
MRKEGRHEGGRKEREERWREGREREGEGGAHPSVAKVADAVEQDHLVTLHVAASRPVQTTLHPRLPQHWRHETR